MYHVNLIDLMFVSISVPSSCVSVSPIFGNSFCHYVNRLCEAVFLIFVQLLQLSMIQGEQKGLHLIDYSYKSHVCQTVGMIIYNLILSILQQSLFVSQKLGSTNGFVHFSSNRFSGLSIISFFYFCCQINGLGSPPVKEGDLTP